MDDGFQNILDADTLLALASDGFIGRDGQDILELLFGRRDIGVGQVDLVDDRDDCRDSASCAR